AQERALNDRLAIATEAVGLGTYEIDLVEGRLLWVENPIKGLEYILRDCPTLEKYAEAIHPEDRDVLPNALRNAFATGSKHVSFRYRAFTETGSIIHVQTYAYLVPNEQGRMVRLLGAAWDVTKEVEAAERFEQQARQESLLLTRLSMATEAAGICSWEIDLNTNRFLWTENWLPALGDTRPDRSQSTDAFLAARVHPEDRDIFRDAVVAALHSKTDRFSLRYRAIGADGNIVHVQSHALLMRDETGWAHSLLGVSWDVTREVEDQQRLEEQRRQQEVLLERLKLSSEAAGISSFEVDMERGIFLWSENPIASLKEMDMSGVSLDDFANEIVLPEDRTKFRDAARRALKERKHSFSFRYRGYGKNGNIVHVENHAHFVVDQNSGRAVRLLGVSWDVTANVEAAEKLERQRVQQQLLLERLSIATQVADISSWEIDLRIPEFLWIENPIKALIKPGDSHYSVAELQKRIHPEDRSIFAEKIAEAMRLGTDRLSYRYRGVGKDGAVVHVQNYVKLFFDENGRPISALGASWDVTKEIQAAEQLAQQAEQLRIAERRLERASLSSSEGHWEADITNGRVWLSSSYHTLLGYPQGELPTDFDELSALLHPEDLQRHRHALKRHIEDGVPYSIDCRIRCGNGEYRWFRQRGTAERDAEGRAITIAGSIQ
ncbi:MAG TPA: PAS domain-containing protein, partial [Steroidobacteraceae bacterium]